MYSAILVMYRNGGVVSLDPDRGGDFWAWLVDEYLRGDEWWPLKCNESMWIVPGTLQF